MTKPDQALHREPLSGSLRGRLAERGIPSSGTNGLGHPTAIPLRFIAAGELGR
jgi:hypothetical protein